MDGAGAGGPERTTREEGERGTNYSALSMRITSSRLLRPLAWECDSHSNFEKAFISLSLSLSRTDRPIPPAAAT